MKKVTILIPIFNEKSTIADVLALVKSANFCGLEKEIILIDDCSTDGTREILKTLESEYKVLYHQKNMGKGAALRTGIKNSTGDIIVIQDADLEYNPSDYDSLIKCILDEKADVCYGSRLAVKDGNKKFLI